MHNRFGKSIVQSVNKMDHINTIDVDGSCTSSNFDGSS